MQLQVIIKGDKALMKKLDRLGDSINHLGKPMRRIGRDLAHYYSTVGHASQGGVFGAKWPPLSRAYALRKASIWRGRPPLVASGQMQDSYAYDAGDTQVRITNKASYHKYHQSTAPRTKMPRRPTMGINRHVRGIVGQHIESHIRSRLRAA